MAPAAAQKTVCGKSLGQFTPSAIKAGAPLRICTILLDTHMMTDQCHRVRVCVPVCLAAVNYCPSGVCTEPCRKGVCNISAQPLVLGTALVACLVCPALERVLTVLLHCHRCVVAVLCCGWWSPPRQCLGRQLPLLQPFLPVSE